MKVPFYKHQLGTPEITAFTEAVQAEIITTGDEVLQFEQDFSKFLGVKHCIALQSCTAALQLSLESLKFTPGSEVITTPFTFVATALAIIQARLTPVFCDVDKSTGNIDLDKVASYINPNTVAIMPVHLYGQMVDMERLNSICNKFQIACIEDSAHCIEGSRNGIRPGKLSNAACFSFYATKNMTCGEGGCVVTDSDDLSKMVRLMRSHGVSKTAYDRHRDGYSHWDLAMLGWKYNLDNLHASILRPQIKKINQKLKLREAAVQYYEKKLSTLSELTSFSVQSHVVHARHLFPILVQNSSIRDSLLSHLKNDGIGVVVNYRSLDNYKALMKECKYDQYSFVNASNLGDRVISLPLYPQISKDELDHVINSILNFFNAQSK